MQLSGNAALSAIRHCFDDARLDSPRTGIILGSGLGAAGDRLLAEGGCAVAYRDILGMLQPQVAGHSGRLIGGTIHGQPVVMLQGRLHYYEGHPAEDIIFGTHLLIELGIHNLIVTNAAGGIHPEFRPGQLMLIRDHVRSLPFRSFRAEWPQGSRAGQFEFGAGQHVWDASLRTIAKSIPTSLTLHEGVYAMMPGPCYETPAEIRMMSRLGADAVGMSTVPEALYAASQGISVLGISCITNAAAGLSDQQLSHGEVTATASSIEDHFVNWIWDLVRKTHEHGVR
jgi:purine-nucleoside phosphorylase